MVLSSIFAVKIGIGVSSGPLFLTDGTGVVVGSIILRVWCLKVIRGSILCLLFGIVNLFLLQFVQKLVSLSQTNKGLILILLLLLRFIGIGLLIGIRMDLLGQLQVFGFYLLLGGGNSQL